MQDHPWSLIDDRDELDELTSLLRQLREMLAEERAAVARLDPSALEDTSRCKEAIAGRLRQLAERASSCRDQRGAQLVRPANPEIETMRAHIRVAADQLAAEARANQALLADAVALVAEALGAKHESATYDRRAKRSQRLRAFLNGAA